MLFFTSHISVNLILMLFIFVVLLLVSPIYLRFLMYLSEELD
jgi:hypothetical protein